MLNIAKNPCCHFSFAHFRSLPTVAEVFCSRPGRFASRWPICCHRNHGGHYGVNVLCHHGPSLSVLHHLHAVRMIAVPWRTTKRNKRRRRPCFASGMPPSRTRVRLRLPALRKSDYFCRLYYTLKTLPVFFVVVCVQKNVLLYEICPNHVCCQVTCEVNGPVRLYQWWQPVGGPWRPLHAEAARWTLPNDWISPSCFFVANQHNTGWKPLGEA